MELSSPNIKKIYIFSKKYFREMEPPKTLLIFQEGTFRACKIKKKHSEKFHIFSEMKLSNLKLKKLLYFRSELAKPQKQTKKPPLKKFLVSYNVFVIFKSVKQKFSVEQKYNIEI